MAVKILHNDRAVLVSDEGLKILAVADLHLSDEDDSFYDILPRLKSLIKKHKPNVLIINGDMLDFHLGGQSLEKLEAELSKLTNVELMQGNHDPEFFEPVLATENYCFCHGDIDYMVDKNLIIGHTHAFLKGKPVFLKGKLNNGKEFLVLPPFNESCKGPDIIKEKNELLGFIFRKKMVESCEAIDLEGKKIADLKF